MGCFCLGFVLGCFFGSEPKSSSGSFVSQRGMEKTSWKNRYKPIHTCLPDGSVKRQPGWGNSALMHGKFHIQAKQPKTGCTQLSESYFKKKLEPIKVKQKSVSQLLAEMSRTAYQGRKLGEAVDVWENMLREKDLTIAMGFAGP